ncbi:arsinothricin resistance N-acetyltransferase ArsN1 family B [Lutibacter sp.]|uniref:arsinothricin resistance N-acetyltransferase ArsN1 family B n=1 Tax=Lutibacter sp. TaxID=1925666 RepID=UPI003562F7EF
MIRTVKLEDAQEIAEIYNYYILNSCVTFEEIPVSNEEMGERIQAAHSKFPWLVYEKGKEIIGYAYASVWKPRSAYKYTIESTVYLKKEARKKGIGSLLYKELLMQIRDLGFHAVIGGISLPNEASVALHEKFGFEKIAQFKEVGYKFKKWIDVGYWELLINKNSI